MTSSILLCRRLRLFYSVYPGHHVCLKTKLGPRLLFGSSLRCLTSYLNTTKFDLTDLTCPHTWYSNARRKKRNVFLHVGPTNSGKTYTALKQLETSSSGVYCGPLRLLAWEIAQRLNKANVPCNLITGQEKYEVDGAKHTSLTVEMADVTSECKCAVIDEIQMVGCKTRGFAFTRALLGIASDELHVCGDPAAVPLIQRILEVTGDVVKVQYYHRLSPLIPLSHPLGSSSNIKTGDCIVTFSRHEIYKLKKKIEKDGKHLCSVVYGSLPPETRTKQAIMFNDESSDFDVLVASDAIGMGLNLNISRIIFSTLKKFDGVSSRELTIPEIKQIAGRAGRYGSKFPVGEVTCLNAEDLPLLHSSLESSSPDLKRAGLFPTFELLSLYSRLQSTNKFHPILFLEKAKLSPDYFIADCEHILKVAMVVDELPLGLHEKYIFCISPVDMDDDISAQALIQFAENYANKGLVRLREIFTPETLEAPKTQVALKELESIHKVLDLYVWLSFRMEESFPDRELASSQKEICSLLIEDFLERSGWHMRRKASHKRSTMHLLKCKKRPLLSSSSSISFLFLQQIMAKFHPMSCLSIASAASSSSSARRTANYRPTIWDDSYIQSLPIHFKWADLCKAFLVEAKWYHNGYTPTLDEYLENAWVTIGGICPLITSYYLSDDLATEALKSLEFYPPIIHHSCMLLRLYDDLGTTTVEMSRGDVSKSIQCYMKEKNISESTARDNIRSLIRNYWKKLNLECTICSKTMESFNKSVLNLPRTAQYFYQYGDGYGELNHETREQIIHLIIEPIPL